MTLTDEQIEKAARAICAEGCAFRGEPPCWKIDPDGWPSPECDEPGCMALALAALEAVMPGEPENECDCSERAPAGEYWICPDCDAEWFPEEEAHPAPEPGELERRHAVAEPGTEEQRTWAATVSRLMRERDDADEENERLRAENERLREAMWKAHSALDAHLGDSDMTHYETDDELREDDPVQWAAMVLASAALAGGGRDE